MADEQQHDRRPDPDPTRLTVDAVRQSVERAKEYTDLRIGTVEERFERVDERVAATARTAEQHVAQLRRERELVTSAQQEAIAKAEFATEKRFESVNEFRAQLSDTISQFLPREVAEAQIAEIRKQISDINDRLNRLAGEGEGRAGAFQGLSTTAQLVLGTVAIIVTVLLANGLLH